MKKKIKKGNTTNALFPKSEIPVQKYVNSDVDKQRRTASRNTALKEFITFIFENI